MFLSSVDIFLRIEKMNIGGAFGLISVSRNWMYAVIFSLIALRISLIKNIGSLSWIFSMPSKSCISFLNSGRLCFCLNSLYVFSRLKFLFSID